MTENTPAEPSASPSRPFRKALFIFVPLAMVWLMACSKAPNGPRAGKATLAKLGPIYRVAFPDDAELLGVWDEPGWGTGQRLKVRFPRKELDAFLAGSGFKDLPFETRVMTDSALDRHEGDRDDGPWAPWAVKEFRVYEPLRIYTDSSVHMLIDKGSKEYVTVYMVYW